MYSIGELSKLVRISIDTLRHYDEIGLLKPHYTDPASRYRYYSKEQINEILMILQWKQLGFGLEMIKELLVCTDSGWLEAVCREQMADLEAKRVHLDHAIVLLNDKLISWGNEKTMNPRTAFIVDDSAFMRETLSGLLENNSWKIAGTAADGSSALQQYGELKPDVVILDIGLPDIDGMDVAAQLKRADPLAQIVFCSARGTIRNVLHGLYEGAAGFVVKPFLPDALLSAVTAPETGAGNRHKIAELLADSKVGQLEEILTQDKVNAVIRLFHAYEQGRDLRDDLWHIVAG